MLLIDFGVLSIQELTAGPLRQASRTELGYLLSEFLTSLTVDAFAVVIIDEAQNLSLPLIEETRILADTFGAKGRLQIVFVGQPELHAKLKLPDMRQVDQRVCGYHRLAPLNREGVDGYIQHRLHVAGLHRERVLFPPEIVSGIHGRSGGVPRLINRVCDRALQLAYERKAERVDREILDTALIEVGAATLSPTWDSIIFAEAPTTPAAATSAPTKPTALPAVELTPPIDDDDHFEKQIDHWVAQDLTAPPPPRTVKHAPERRTSSKAVPSTAPRRESPGRTVKTDWPRDLRSETYMHRLWRIWSKRAAIALGLFVAVNGVLMGASLLPDMVAPVALPAVPEAPASAVPDLVVPEAPQSNAPVPIAAASSVAESGDYLVAVGLFASRDRADQLVDALSKAGLPAMQRDFQLRRQQVQQIVLGPYFSRADAAASLRRLQQLGGYSDATVIDSARAPSAQ
jgi:cell division septation protein DedD